MVIANPPLAEPVIDPGGVTIKPPFEMGVANWINVFESFAEQNKEELDFEFLILYVDQFNSGFRKQEFENLEIIFPELRKPCRFREVTNVLKAEKSKGEKYFYIFYSTFPADISE